MPMTRKQFKLHQAQTEATREWHDSQRRHWYAKAQAAMLNAGLFARGPADCIEHGPAQAVRFASIGRRHATLARSIPRQRLGIL